MKYENSPFLKAQFRKDGHPLADAAFLEVDANLYQRHLDELRRTSSEPEQVKSDRAVYRALTHGAPPRRKASDSIPVPVITLTEFLAVARQHRKIQIVGFSVLAMLEILRLLL